MIVDFDKTRAGKHGARPEVGFSTHANTPSKLTKYNNLASTQWQWHAKGVRREEPVEVQVVHRKKSKGSKTSLLIVVVYKEDWSRRRAVK